MSRRGGGRGGRTENRRDQPTISSSQSSSSRGGAGGGRGRGGARGGRGAGNIVPGTQPVATTQADYPPLVAKVSASPAAASTSSTPSRPSTTPTPAPVVSPADNPPQTQSSVDPAPVAAVSTTASATGTSLSGEVEKKLVLQAPPPSSSKALRFPQRPGYGTIGTKIFVRANHFLVEIADKDLHQYDVSMSPEVTSKKICRDVMKELSNLYRESHLGGRMFAYDGRKSLYTAGPLPFNLKEFVIKLDKDSESSRRIRQFKVAIKFASKPDLHHLQQFIRGRQLDVPQETIQVLDVVLRAAPSEKYTVIGRSFFAPNLGPRGESGRGDLGNGLEYWRGFYQSLRPTQMGLSLNVDISARSFYDPILVTDFIKKHFNFRDTSRPLSDQDCVKIKRALRGVRVEVSHQGNSRKYKITGVSSRPLSQLTFPLEDSSRMSVVKYFRDKYGVVLKDVALPALQAGNDSNPVFLPMEICQIVAGQRYTKKLNEGQIKSLLTATCRRPDLRENDIKQMVERNNFNVDELVSNEFGIRVKEQLTLVEARVLPPPMLKYHDSGRQVRENPKMGAWNMVNKKMIDGGRVEFWTCINFATGVHPNFPLDFCVELVNICMNKGMSFNLDPLIPIRSANIAQSERALNEVHMQSQAELKRRGQENKRLQLLIIIFPDKTGYYGTIKRVCETELGIITQCCLVREALKFKEQTLVNLALKINVKVGGRNTVLNDAIHGRIPHVNDRPTIIFGADVTHPQPGEDSSPSIAAVVASMDWPEVTKYRGIVAAQEHRQEIILDLFKTFRDPQKGEVSGGIIRELLIAFRRSTGHKPHRIIFYRDGVSEGQFSQVLFYEVDAIRKACQSLEEGYLPPITFVVVQKRHNTRLFPDDPKNKDRSGNILPGTVVEHKICHPTEFDFYLNSHAGILGTSRPTHYHVLYDENHFTADALQTLTNNLCYTYARCTRSVSIVPPAYYAHLAAFRARFYIEGNASDSGSTVGVRSSELRPLPAIMEHIKDVMFYC